MEFAPQVRDATEAIQQVPPLVGAILNLLQTPAGWAVLAALFFWFLVNKDFSHVFGFLERRERRRFEYLDLYIAKHEVADEGAVKVLRDLRDAHYFKIGTGIYAEKKLRIALIGLHERISYIVSWRQIRRAVPYIEADQNGNISIRKLSRVEIVGYWYNQLVGYASLLVAAGTFSFLIFLKGMTLSALMWCIGGGLAALFFAIFVFAQNLPANSAKRIHKELKQSNLSEEQNT